MKLAPRCHQVLTLLAMSALAGNVGADEAAPEQAGMTLASAYKLALARSEDTLLGRQGVASAAIERRQTTSLVKPQAFLTGSAIVQRELESPALMGVDVLAPFVATAGGRVTQPLFRRGYFDARAAADKGVEAAQAAQARTAEMLMMDVTTAYIAVLRSREQVRLAKDAVTRAETQLKITQARLKAGGALKTAEQLAAIEVERSKLLAVQTERDRESQAVQFEQLVGKAPPDELAFAEITDVPALDQCLARTTQRSDSRALRLLAEQSRLRESAARGRRWPTLDAQGGVNYYTYLFPLGDNVYEWSARLVVTVPLFQGGAEYTEIEQQKVRSEIATLRASLRDKEITSEMKRAAISLTSAESAVAVTESQARVALEHYNLITAQFKVAAVTFLDVANAQAILTAAEDQRIRARYDRELSKYQVLYTCGTLKL